MTIEADTLRDEIRRRYAEVAGWAALSPISDRCVYGGVAENSIYIHPDHRGRRAGTALLAALIASSEAAGIWTVQTGIFPENIASVALHERVGFRIIGGAVLGRSRELVMVVCSSGSPQPESSRSSGSFRRSSPPRRCADGRRLRRPRGRCARSR